MKKTIVFTLLLCLALTVSLTGCISTLPADIPVLDEGDEPSPTPAASGAAYDFSGDVSVPNGFDAEDGEVGESVGEFLREKLGAYDPDSGFEMSYGVMGSFVYENVKFYCVSVRWLVQGEDGSVTNSSRLGELVVDADLSAAYNAELMSDELVIHFDSPVSLG